MRSSTSYKKGHVPWIKGRRFGVRSKSVKQKISDGNIEYWKKQTEEFLATDPICAACFTALTNFSRLMLCDGCRCYYNNLAFKLRNPGYTIRYSRKYKRRKRAEKKIADSLFPFTGLKERTEKEAIRTFYKEEREGRSEEELEERRRKSAFCYRRTVSS